jgi:uncharacterized membrane protein YkoI
MNRRTRVVVASGIAAAALAGAGIAVAGATNGFSGDDDGNEVPITGEALERASAVALAHTGEGRVTETEMNDEDSYYEVEVTLDDGSQVDVQLDAAFNVVGAEGDSDDGADAD